MKLSDIMSGANLTIWAQLSLIVFLVAFVAVVVHTYAKKRRRTFEDISRIPLDDEQVQIPRSKDPNPAEARS